jgi:hypothetical protein
MSIVFVPPVIEPQYRYVIRDEQLARVQRARDNAVTSDDIAIVSEIAGASGRETDKGQSEHTRQFRVVTTAATVGDLDVIAAPGIPRRGDVYATGDSTDLGSIVKEISAEQDSDNPRVWIVRVEYGPPANEREQDQEPNPLLRPAVLSWGFAKSSRVAWRDSKGKPVVNSAGEFFDPPVECDDSRPVLTISRNERSFNPALAISYQDSVNADSFLGFRPGVVKVAGISATNQVENNFFYWAVHYEFEFRREGWTTEILDQGRNRLVDGKLVPIYQRDKNGQPIDNLIVAVPVKLNGEGGELVNSNPEIAHYVPYFFYKSLPFSALRLP